MPRGRNCSRRLSIEHAKVPPAPLALAPFHVGALWPSQGAQGIACCPGGFYSIPGMMPPPLVSGLGCFATTLRAPRGERLK